MTAKAERSRWAALAHRSPGLGRRYKAAIGTAAIIGLALFYGDGMLTPAVSVLSAVEGLGVGSHAFQPLVIPLTLVILIALFLFQSHGTAKIGRLFGPIMVVWFIVLAVLGLTSILHAPGILVALNPYYGFALFEHEPWTAFVALGSVVLAVTGCEALYADMGHFGRKPIQRAWLFIVLPALLLNYFGQGAMILHHPRVANVVFYSLAPAWAHYPLVLLATCAAIIASQAVISGVFSITRQAVQLGQLPRMEIRHTSATDYGQIFVPMMNMFMLFGVVLIVLIFHTSGALAAAYGIAVSGVMLIDTFNASIVAARQWKWGVRQAAIVFGVLAFIDLAFLLANSLKIVEGGWLPLAIATGVFIVMETWSGGVPISNASATNPCRSIFSWSAPTRRRHGLRVRPSSFPRAAIPFPARCCTISNTTRFSTNASSSCMSRSRTRPSCRPAVASKSRSSARASMPFRCITASSKRRMCRARSRKPAPMGLPFDIDTATFFIGHETLVLSDHPVLGSWRTRLYMMLASGALSPARYYKLPPNRVVELGTQVSI